MKQVLERNLKDVNLAAKMFFGEKSRLFHLGHKRYAEKRQVQEKEGKMKGEVTEV